LWGPSRGEGPGSKQIGNPAELCRKGKMRCRSKNHYGGIKTSLAKSRRKGENGCAPGRCRKETGTEKGQRGR